MTRAVAFVLHPGFQMLDVTGPVAAFEIAERYRPGSYALRVTAPDVPLSGAMVESSSGLGLWATPLDLDEADTVVISGGEIIRSQAAATEIVGWLQRVKARRIASVCSGAFLLAGAGLLDGRRATTHWASSDHFRRAYPKVRLEPDQIFTRDGDVWTSAGITAGIDLALALIEDDLGADISRRVAQQLVVHQRRPGGQSQFAETVELCGPTGRFAPVLDWVREHLGEPLTVEQLADKAAMSPRHFARAFRDETGATPAKAVERLRLETARRAVESSHAPLDRIAENAGFGDAGRMRRAFMRGFGQPPQALRRAARSGQTA